MQNSRHDCSKKNKKKDFKLNAKDVIKNCSRKSFRY